MRRYCNCCFAAAANAAIEAPIQGNTESAMNELLIHPSHIDAKLEKKLADWQNAMNDYQAYEDICLEELGDDLGGIIEKFRINPIPFKDKKYHPNVVLLATKLLKVRELEGKLDFAGPRQSLPHGAKKSVHDRELDQSRTCSRSMMVSVGEDFEEEDAFSVITADDDDTFSHGTRIADKLSSTWANRLNHVNPTQGSLFVAGNQLFDSSRADYSEEGASPLKRVNRPDNQLLMKSPARDRIKIKPKWPDFLTDTFFDVIKVNKYGHRMRRILKLNQHYVLSIKNGCEISKFYHYSQVRRIWLENGSTIIVVQKNGKQNVYLSHIAPHVLQQISTRVQVRMSLDKADFLNPTQSLSYTPMVTASIIRAISEENVMDTEMVMAIFANDLKERTVSSLATDSASIRRALAADKQANEERINKRQTTGDSSSYSMGVDNQIDNYEDRNDNGTQLEHATVAAAESDFDDVAQVLNEIVTTVAAASDESVDPVPSVGTPSTCEIGRASWISDKHIDASPSTSSVGTPSSSQRKSHRSGAPRLLSYREGMPEYSVQSAVRKVIYDDSTVEGHTRKVFIEKIRAQHASPVVHSTRRTESSSSSVDGASADDDENEGRMMLEVRHFIDGMHEYLLANRGVSLAILFEREKQRYMINSANESRPSSTLSVESSLVTRDRFSRALGKTISLGHRKHSLTSISGSRTSLPAAENEDTLTSRSSLQFLKENNLDISLIDDATLVFISYVIFIVVEEAVFLPLKNNIIPILPASIQKESKDHLLSEKMATFKRRTQSQWGVPDPLVSPLGWQSAIFELNSLEHNLTPSAQLHTLTRTVKAIYNEFKHVLLPELERSGKKDLIVSADDLVPIFMFVFSQSSLRHPMRNRDLMWGLCHPVQLHGEAGYYLTIYESSIEFVLNEPITNESFDVPGSGSKTASSIVDAHQQTVNPLHNKMTGIGLEGNQEDRSSLSTTSAGAKSNSRSANNSVLSGGGRQSSVDGSDQTARPNIGSDSLSDKFFEWLGRICGLNCLRPKGGRASASSGYDMRESFRE